MTIIEAIADPALFARFFLDKSTWRAWLVVLRALFALPMPRADRALYRKLTGRRRAPTVPASEAWLIVGRRGGKSFIVALIAVFLATFRDWKPYLAPGERGTIMVIATDRRQARVILRYVAGLLDACPMLAALVERRAGDAIDLSNGVSIECHTASFRAVRGYTVIAALLDEVAFWRDADSANPDHEIVEALRPAMATIPGALLIGLGTPYRRSGVLWQAHRAHYAKDGDDVLVVQAETRVMNCTVPKRTITAAYERDPAHAAAEWGAEFRSDIETFVGHDALDAVTVPGRRELASVAGVNYVAFVDPSGGSQDSMTLAIAHDEGARIVIDCIRERRPPFSPEAVVIEFAETLQDYHVSTVIGDRYAGEWPRERFREHGITYDPAAKPKSDLYRDLLPAINSGAIELLEHDRLAAQFAGLERRTGRGGRDSIDHAPGAHDDVANAVAGAVALAAGRAAVVELWGGGDAITADPRHAGFRPIDNLSDLGSDTFGDISPW